MAGSEEQWPKGYGRLVPGDYAHALGYLVVYYNNAERSLYLLTNLLLKNDRAACEVINHHLHNSARLDLLRELATELPEEERECVLHAVGCFDICAENRNTMMHAVLVPSDDPTDDLSAQKRHSAKPGETIKFDLPLARLRQSVDQTTDVYFFIVLLVAYFAQKLGGRPPTLPLPDKPQKPDKLNLPPPPSVQKSGKDRRSPSRL
jgi:hypothetical protein